MSAKSSLEALLKKFNNNGFTPVPEDRRPTAKSIKKTGDSLNSYLESNDAMRARSMANASAHFTS